MLRFRRQRISHPLTDTDLLTVILEWDDEGRGWASTVPTLNHISTCGDTQKEALDRTCEMIWGYLDSMRDLRLPTGLTPSQDRRLRRLLKDHADGLASERAHKDRRRIPLKKARRPTP